MEKRAMLAADLTTRIAEDLLSAGTLSFGQLHLYGTPINSLTAMR